MLLGLTLTLALQLQSGAPSPLSRGDSIASARAVARIRREEARFFAMWRREWQNQRDLYGTDPRFWSLHCHWDDVLPGDENNVITSRYSRKSMCPIWFQERGSRGDESVNIDNGIPARSREKVRKERAEIIAMLDSAAQRDPGNPWILGQRVRLEVDQQNYARAAIIAADDCHSAASYCAMLEGYVLDASGNRKGAEAAFGLAASVMSPKDRCGYLDASVLFDPGDRASYEELACADRMPLDEKFWWLADPLWIQSGNERLTVHLQRQTLLLLRSSLTTDEHFDYRVKYGGASVAEMLLRYGWHSVSFHHFGENENHNSWLGFRDSASNASHEYFRPRYHTAPPLSAVREPAALRGTEVVDISPPWLPKKNAFDEFWWPVEHIARPGRIDGIDFQSAIFRRAKAPFVTVAADPRSNWITPATLARYTTALVAMTGPRDSARVSTTATRLEAGGASVSMLPLRPGGQVVSLEIVDMESDSAPAARARFGVTAPEGLGALAANELAISDIMLFAAPSSESALPRSVYEAADRMLPSAVAARDRVGVFFELYGLKPAEPVDVTLSVIPQDQPGALKRLGSRLGIAEAAPGATVIRFEAERQGMASAATTIDGVVINARAIVLNLSSLAPGRYVLEVGVERSGQRAVSQRDFVLRR